MEQSYKEKYEQALSKAKDMLNYKEVRREDMEYLFPELAENKDEKIRKALLEMVHDTTGDELWVDYNVHKEEALAWLEKQGETSPILSNSSNIGKDEQKPKENKGNIGGISPNWSEEDEENFCSVYLDVKSARQNTVNSLSGELKEQEQKRMDEVISWLRSLKGRVLPKQEWSEEDEQHIDSLLKRLDALCRNKFERTRFAISEDRDWLKSLRPQNRWRPSELQLGCLSDAIEYYNSFGYTAPKLKELYEQLKKLKEG